MSSSPSRERSYEELGFSTESVTKKYNIKGKIGSGTYGHVYRGQDKESGIFYAIKQIPKNKIKQ